MEDVLKKEIDSAIDGAFAKIASGGLCIDGRICAYVKRGKKVRPLSLLLSVAGRNPELLNDQRVTRVAAAIEIAHRSTLVSDDVVDGQKERNGLPTIEATAGRAVAILAAPLLQALAIEVCPYEFRGVLNAAIQSTLAGQIQQENQSLVSLAASARENARIVNLKSSSIETAALRIADVLSCGQEQEGTRETGLCLARAYQTCNDLADFHGWFHGECALLPADLRNRTLTFPILDVLRTAPKRDARILTNYMRGESADEMSLRAVFQNAGCYSRCMAFIDRNLSVARNALVRLIPPGRHLDLFVYYVESVWKKDYLMGGA